MQKNRGTEIIFGLIFAVSAISGYLAYRYHQYITEPVTIRICNANESEVNLINQKLEQMTSGARGEVDIIFVVEKLSPNNSGQCMKNAKLDFCTIVIERHSLGGGTIWHEVFHAHFLSLPEKAKREWRAMLGRPDYIGDAWDKENLAAFPHDGLISPYGRKNIDEDVATWGEAIHNHLNDQLSWLRLPFDKQNPIYPQILAWFLKWDFINQKQHDRVNEIFN